jgi:hypothetical protein
MGSQIREKPRSGAVERPSCLSHACHQRKSSRYGSGTSVHPVQCQGYAAIVLLPTLARILRLASIVICLIALASFATFALDQTGSASSHQQTEVNEAGAPGTTTTGSSKPGHESALHEALDKTFSTLSSPFSGITSGSTSQWTIQIVDTLLVLLVYGFGLSFVARVLPGKL